MPETHSFDDDLDEDRPWFGPVVELHRHRDGYVSLAAKSDDDFRVLRRIRCSKLTAQAPAILGQLEKDIYVSINASFTSRNHNSDTLRYLCACYADIDFRLANIDANAASQRIWDAFSAGLIPRASAWISSGRGAWLLWFLRDPEDPMKAERAWPENIELYGRIQRALIKRLADIGADPKAKDPVRHIRVPGSLNTESETRVSWWLSYSGLWNPRHIEPVVYTLTELAEFFGVAKQKTRVKVSPDKKPNPRKRIGWNGLHQRRLEDFELLRSLRGGFSDGCRGYAVFLYAWLLRNTGCKQADAARKVAELAAQCRPPLSKSVGASAMKSATRTKGWKIRDSTIAEYLNITPDEADWLEQNRIARTTQESAISKVLVRRRAIQEIIAEQGRLPCRKMADLLRSKGFKVGHSQVANDYRAIK